MTAVVLNAMIVTVASDGALCAQMPRCVITALCAINMLLMLEDDLFRRREHKFNDFVVSPLGGGDGARVTFGECSELSDVVIDDNALRHLKTVGNFRALRLYDQRRAKL